MASKNAEFALTIIKLLADMKFRMMIDRTSEGRARYDAMGEGAKELFSKTYELGFVEGYVEALQASQPTQVTADPARPSVTINEVPEIEPFTVTARAEVEDRRTADDKADATYKRYFSGDVD